MSKDTRNWKRSIRKFSCKVILIFLWMVISSHAWAVHLVPDYSMALYDKTIEKMYQDPALKTKNMARRIEIISAYFLGKPYLLGALGEGKQAIFDQDPIYRTDAFDCVTYVATVLALANANNLKEFQQQILKIQYRNGKPTFLNRLHFSSIDWNAVNEKNGFIEDITDKVGKTAIAYAMINKPGWYQKMTTDNLQWIHPASKEIEDKRLQQLRNLSQKVSIEVSRVPYLPWSTLFDNKGNPNRLVFDKIPSGSIIEIVRPNWDLDKEIGTHLNISHLGFAIRIPQGLMFREASLLSGKVIDISLVEYLKSYLSSPTIRGIHVEAVRQK